MIKDFRNFATKHQGINGLAFDDVIKAQSGYLNPYILEERQLNVTQLDVFSRLMMDRIIFLGTEVNDYTANVLQAQLLYLDSLDNSKDISIYINSPGGSVYAGLGIYDTMQFAQYGMLNIPDEYLENATKEMFKKRETVDNLIDRCIEVKLGGAIKEAVTLEESTVSAEDFNKMFE